ncbi:hydroxyacylglutathione hydrolase [Chiayiivirga flava]|uniref:hydroxyacylglutathione hydrolase n=1 Tax=Chiayiivirga flava TaxID=659595 RepID=UPI00160D7770|nr:hydroxyacylglutathione hydrolase [Chiayiivirga flava]
MTLRALPAFDDNYIWCLHDAAGRAVVVDPGDAAPVLAAADAGLRPVALLLTHHHNDHIGGAAQLRERFAMPCFAPDDPRIESATERVGDGDTIRIEALALAFTVLAVPGHTTSHVAFHGAGRVFCGDTLFSLGCGRLFEGTPAQMLASLDRLAALPDATQVCCGHEYTLANGRFAQAVEPHNPALEARLAEVRALRDAGQPSLPVTMARERATNPFLRCEVDAVIEAVAAHEGARPSDRLATFTALRRWKDGFRA